MFPLRDLNATRRTPVVTYTLIAVNLLVFLWELTIPAEDLDRIFAAISVVPANIAQNPLAWESILDIMRSMFLHAGWLHVGSNMLYLYLFGDNVEDRFGWILYLVLYVASGFVAVYTQVFVDPTSTVPLVGASGAIAGVLGSYLILYPGVRVRGIVPLGKVSWLAEWPAWLVLALWFVVQIVDGMLSLGSATANAGGVAFFAHVGGFLAGILITWLYLLIFPQPSAAERTQTLYVRVGR